MTWLLEPSRKKHFNMRHPVGMSRFPRRYYYDDHISLQSDDATQFAQHSCQDNHPLFRPGLHYCIILNTIYEE